MVLGTIADITPNSTATPLSSNTNPILATWIIAVANGTSIRIGDASVGAARGVVCPSGIPVTIPRGDFDQQGYDLSKVYVYGTSSDKVSITYGV